MRKWLVRGLIFLVLGALAAGGWGYHLYTNPTAVRREVVEQLNRQFLGTRVTLDSARLRLFGGISLQELRLSRLDDPDRVDYFYVPHAIFYHDKEALAEGRLVLRKIELHQPRLRIIREADGRCNLAGILGPVDLATRLPTIVVKQGTIIFEDRLAAPHTPPVELHGVNLTMINDPLAVLVFEGSGRAPLTGPVQLRGTWRRDTLELTTSIQALDLPIGPATIARLGCYCPEAAEHGQRLEGKGKISADFTCQFQDRFALHYDVHAQLVDGKFAHAQLPRLLERINASARWIDGQLTLERLEARAGEAKIELKGRTRLDGFCPDTQCASPACPGPGPGEPDGPPTADLEGELRVENLVLTPELLVRLPEHMQALHKEYAPSGRVRLAVKCQRRGSQWYKHCLLQPEDLQVTYAPFRYTLEHVRGTVEHESDPFAQVERFKLDLVGYAGQRPIYIKGEIKGAAGEEVHLDIWGSDIPLDEKLILACPENTRDLARSFEPTGFGNFLAQIRREKGSDEFSNHYYARFHHASVRYRLFPYPIQNVSGVLEIHPDHWEFRDFRGTNKDCVIRTHGRAQPDKDGYRVSVAVAATDAPLDADLEAAVAAQPKLKAAWKEFAPSGRIDLTAKIEYAPQQAMDLDVAADLKDCRIKPAFFPYAVNDIRGKIRYARDWVHVKQLRGTHGASVLAIDEGLVYLKPEGGYWAQLANFKANPLVPDDDLLAALPVQLQKLMQGLQIKDAIGLNTLAVVDQGGEPSSLPVIYWDGGVALREATLHIGVPFERVTGRLYCRGRHNGRHLEGVLGNLLIDQAVVFKQPFRNIHSQLEIPKDTPDVLRLPNLKGQVFGGDVGGEARVEFGSTLHYDINLTALQVNLEEFGRHNLPPPVGPPRPALRGMRAEEGSQMSGQAMARLYLSGRGSDIAGLEGRGSIDIPSGKIYNLPILLDLLKVLGLRMPDRTAFDEVHAAFTIRGPRVKVDRLDLLGNAVSLGGDGELNLDGSDLELDFYAVWGRIVQMLPPSVRDVPPAISQQLLKIKMRGSINDRKVIREPVPILVEPLRRLLNHQAARKDEAGSEKMKK